MLLEIGDSDRFHNNLIKHIPSRFHLAASADSQPLSSMFFHVFLEFLLFSHRVLAVDFHCRVQVSFLIFHILPPVLFRLLLYSKKSMNHRL